MRKTIKNTGKSAPGPDNIPYIAWRLLGELATDALHDVALALGRDNQGEHLESIEFGKELGAEGFNLGNMVLLPKKPTGSHPLFGDYFALSDVRPLMIVNTDNRLIADSYRLLLELLELIMDRWVSTL